MIDRYDRILDLVYEAYSNERSPGHVADEIMKTTGWRPIEAAPPIGTVGILYTPPTPEDDEFDGLDYRYELAIYRETVIGRDWHEQGTNHDLTERKRFDCPMPTHWMPLPAPPGETK